MSVPDREADEHVVCTGEMLSICDRISRGVVSSVRRLAQMRGSQPNAILDDRTRKITSSRVIYLPLWSHRAGAVFECVYGRKFHDGYTDICSHVTFAQRNDQAYGVFREGESHLRQLLRYLS